MRSTRGLAGIGLAIACVVSAWACSSFEAAPLAEDEAGAPVVVAPSPDAAPTDDVPTLPDSGDGCLRLAPRIEERFAVLPAMDLVAEKGGTARILDGVLVASVPSQTGARAVYAKTIDMPSGSTFGRARLRFTFVGLVPPPAGFYIEAGCDLEVSDRASPPRRSSVRIELRSTSMRLDDAVFTGSTTGDSGIGPEIATFRSAPTDYPLVIDVERGDAGLVSTATVGGGTFRKETPLLGGIDRIGIHCGINSTSANGADVTTYVVKLDDVEIDLCEP